MAILVVCPGCKKRFQVSDKFAGQKGPCPNCKTVLQIPRKEDEVVVHEPEQFGPKGRTGEAVLKPIERTEMQVKAPVLVASLAGVAIVLLIAWALRGIADKPLWLLGTGAALLGPLLAYAGYIFLRDDELAPFRGIELWIRVAACGLVYAALWGALAFLNWQLFDNDPLELPMIIVVIPVMMALGAGVAVVSLDLDFTMSLFHYGLYFGVTVLLRVVMGLYPIGPLPRPARGSTAALWEALSWLWC